MRIKDVIAALTVALCGAVTTNAQQLAFPGAQGWGRWAKGARASSAPTVYHVTNLNDSGKGSLRDAVSASNRIVVFDVSGVIRIQSRISFASNLYIAGQTAPGEGITVYGDGVSFSSASNIICRYLRVRMGHGGSSGKDCAGVSNGTNMIFDHCSFSWGLDETFSINPDGKGDLHSITIQNCIVGQGLMTHSAGGLIQADSITLYRNLYCDNSTRNNKVKGRNQFANNIVYNWKNGAYIMGGDSEGKSYVNIESNMFINGPSGGGEAFTGANADFHCYGRDNWQDSNTNGVLDPHEVTNYSASTRESKPYPYPQLELYPGKSLIEMNLPSVGASLPYRDQSDCYMVDEVLSFGTDGALITYETALPIGAPDTWQWWSGEKRTDTDGDGMPDDWETANGTNPTTNDACRKAANGYLNIENYINSITVEDRQFFLRRPITLAMKNATTTTIALSWRDYTYGEEGFAVEMEKEGTWTEVARTAAGATGCTLTDLSPATSYNIRVRAFAAREGNDQYSEYATLNGCMTRPVEAGMIDIDSYLPDVTNSTTVAEGERLLLHAGSGEVLDYKLTSPIAPSSVVATGEGRINVSGQAIGGAETSVNKAGTGVLALNSKNTYQGATVNHEGTIEFSSIANGGTSSAIGASLPFAQNWVFDGGTYRYTGTSATSNRSARIMRPSTLDIASASTTLTMTGIFEGEGALTLDGKGTLSLADISFIGYGAPTTLRGGKLYLSDTENACKALGSSDRKIVFAGGVLQFASRNEDYQELTFPIEVADGTQSIISMPTHCYFKSPLSGNGTLQFDLPYVRAYLRPDLSQFTGKLIGNATKAGALFFHETQWNAPQVRFELKGGVTMSSWNSNATNILGGLSGDAGTFLAGTSKQNKGFTCLWEVGAANSDETFRGTINNMPAGGNSAYQGTTSIRKVGTGLWRLTGSNTYSGTTTVDGGTLIVNGSNSAGGAVTVGADATLKGKGTIGGKVTLKKGATLCPGDTLVDGSTLRINGGLALNAGSTLRIALAGKGADGVLLNSVAVSGTVTVGSGVVLELDMTRLPNHTFRRGDALPIFADASGIRSASGNFTVIPEVPAEGLEWETSTLLIDGMLRVKNQGEEYQGGAITTQMYSAPLEHTASVQGGANTPGKFLDSETHYYNNWGSGSSWFAQAYAQFTLDYPYDEELVKAEYTVHVNCARGTRTFDVCCMPASAPRITSTADIPELTAKVGTELASYSDITTNYTAKTIDVTSAVRTLRQEGKDYILFIMANGAAGGNIYGKGSKTYAPSLSITTRRDPNKTDIEATCTPHTDAHAYTVTGQRLADGSTYRGIILLDGKKYLKK